eukprot:2849680-Prymnesium_polylepis.2
MASLCPAGQRNSSRCQQQLLLVVARQAHHARALGAVHFLASAPMGRNGVVLVGRVGRERPPRFETGLAVHVLLVAPTRGALATAAIACEGERVVSSRRLAGVVCSHGSLEGGLSGGEAVGRGRFLPRGTPCVLVRDATPAADGRACRLGLATECAHGARAAARRGRCRRQRATSPRRRGRARDDLLLDATLVGAALDTEVARLAPIRVPGVGHLPVRSAGIDAPTHNADGMATELLPAGMLVHATRVVLEIRVHSEGGLYGTVGHDRVLDARDVLVRGHVAAKLELISHERLVRRLRVTVASGRATRRGLRRAAGGALRRVRVIALRAMVVAVGQREVGAQPKAVEWPAALLAASNGAL